MKLIWTTEKKKISDLNPAPYNPRVLNEKQEKDLSNSLDRFSLCDPIIINLNHSIIGGHQRIKILKSKGVEEVDVRIPNRLLDEKEEKELNLRLNKNLGEWDLEGLSSFSEDMLKSVGFDSSELDKIFKTENNEKDDDVPEERKETDIKTGDIFILGRHRLMCGDSTKADYVGNLMLGRLADCVVTDPPYNTGMEGKDNVKARLSHMFKDNLTQQEWLEFLESIFNNYFIYTKGECAFYVFIDWRRVSEIKKELEKRMDVKNVIVWDKGVHGLGSDYKFTYELCVVGKKGNPKIENRFGLDYQDIWRVQRDMGRNKNHATSKPVELISKPILHASKRDDIVLDLFLGSGSTLIACEKINRICYGMEIDPIYCQVVIDRWESFTGRKAEKLESIGA